MAEPNTQPNLAERLAEARAMLRSDITVSRHVFQSEPSYMLHDPVSFQNHRLSLQDYSIVAALDDSYTLKECFQRLLASGAISADQEDGFYRFIVRLQALGVLSLPSNNGPELYQRHKAMQKKKLKSLPMQLLFLRIPLARPDAFLQRTAPLFRWMFTTPFFVIWAIAVLVAGGVVFARRDDFFQPLNGTLTASNFITLAAVLLALKVWHELGHGYACKIFGGRVPEMGMMLMMGAPLAYMDASAAWMFPKRRHRLLVMLGGMYFESLVAIPAVFVWAISGPSTLIGSIAYQVVFMATAITLLFNANPLMKYDGYFILSDLIGIPNLKQRATNEIYNKFNRHALGLDGVPESRTSLSTQATLITYGVLSACYRVFIFLSLATVLASHAFILGMAMGLLFLLTSFAGPIIKFTKYLWFAEKTTPVRSRALAVSVVPLFLLPLALIVLPTPGGIRALGVVGSEQEDVIHASMAGFVESVSGRVGQPVDAGTQLLTLANPSVDLQLQIVQARLQKTHLDMMRASQASLSEMTSLKHQVHSLRHSVDHSRREQENLVVRAPTAGSLAHVITNRSRGSFVQIGDPVATVVSGKPTVKVWFTGDQMRMISPEVGDTVSVRFPGARLQTQVGTIRHIAVAADVQLDEAAATHIAGGEIPVNPATGETAEPLVQVTVELPGNIQDIVAHRSQASVSFARSYEPIAFWMARKAMVFIQKLTMS